MKKSLASAFFGSLVASVLIVPAARADVVDLYPEVCTLSEFFEPDPEHFKSPVVELGSWRLEDPRVTLTPAEKEAVVRTSEEYEFFSEELEYSGDTEKDFAKIVTLVSAKNSSYDLNIETYRVLRTGETLYKILSYPGDNPYGAFYVINGTEIRKVGSYEDGSVRTADGKYCE